MKQTLKRTSAIRVGKWRIRKETLVRAPRNCEFFRLSFPLSKCEGGLWCVQKIISEFLVFSCFSSKFFFVYVRVRRSHESKLRRTYSVFTLERSLEFTRNLQPLETLKINMLCGWIYMVNNKLGQNKVKGKERRKKEKLGLPLWPRARSIILKMVIDGENMDKKPSRTVLIQGSRSDHYTPIVIFDLSTYIYDNMYVM